MIDGLHDSAQRAIIAVPPIVFVAQKTNVFDMDDAPVPDRAGCANPVTTVEITHAALTAVAGVDIGLRCCEQQISAAVEPNHESVTLSIKIADATLDGHDTIASVVAIRLTLMTRIRESGRAEEHRRDCRDCC